MSLKLNDEDRRFLVNQQVPMSQIFDAQGRTVGACKEVMAELGAIVAVNTTPCQKGGHRIRTRAGHCAVCDPAKLAYIRRHAEPGYVYVATSKSGNLTKVGTTIDLLSRGKNLNSYAYGGRHDWEIKHYRKCEKAGHYEYEVQHALAAYSVHGTYIKDGRVQACYELFSCTLQQAVDAFNRAVPL